MTATRPTWSPARLLSDTDLDRRDGDAWSIRQIAFHLEESLFYAEAVGHLGSLSDGSPLEGNFDDRS